MITSKQRSYLRGLANTIEPIFQVGKNGIEDSFLKQVEDALKKREIIKLKVLNTVELRLEKLQTLYVMNKM
jgi:RNA-binding protein